MSAFRGALFSVGMRWTDRLVGLLSTFILARLLVPADFGLVTMAVIIVGIIEVFLDLGVANALVQNPKADREHFDSAWTLRLIQATTASVIILLVAPLGATFYGDPRVTDVMRLIALTVMIGGFENIGIVYFQKNMEFDKEFRFFVARRLTAAAIGIVLAFMLRSYWALVLATLSGRVVGLVLSYWMHPFRPHLRLTRVRQIWSYSQWNILTSVSGYIAAAMDKLILGRRTDASTVGAYSLGGDIASMPSTELLAPLGRVMFPAFANVRDNATELLRLTLLSLSVQALIGIPAGVGVALVADDAIPIMLGHQWTVAIPFAQILALVGVATSLAHSSHYLLLATGRIKSLAIYNICMLAAAVLLMVIIFSSAGGEGIAAIRLSMACVGLILINRLATRALPEFSLRRAALETWRPLLSAIIMAAAVLGIKAMLADAPTWASLSTQVIGGAITYVVSVFLLWRLAGSPSGGETYLIEKVIPSAYRQTG